jgi:hypothetical protein
MTHLPHSSGLLIALVAAPCLGCDLVTVAYDPGYPNAFPLSTEATSISESRCSPQSRGNDLPIDQYFEAVRKALSDGQVESSWGVPAVDAPFVKLTIELEGRKITMISTAYDDGAALPLYMDDRDKRYGTAMRSIVKLTVERVAVRLRFRPE